MEAQIQAKEEAKVGITEFISQGRQIPAITKYLLSDFIVNEIDKDQHLVTLHQQPSLEKKPASDPVISFSIGKELQQKIRQLLGEEVGESIRKLYEQLECGEKVPSWELVVEKDLDKQARKTLHDFVREELHFIESLTIPQGKIKLKYNRKLRKMDPKGRKKYTYFTLYKHGVDTLNAVFRLGKVMGITEKLFSTAGLKDKRGHTTQRVSVYNTDMQTLLKFYKEADRNREMWIADFKEFQDDKIEVGGLTGNQFGLILRLLNKDDGEEVLKRVESLKDKGMVNYFGLQRFGQFATKTYQYGILYARKQYRQLVEAIILSDCNNEGANRIKKEIYESKKYGLAEKALHNKYKIQKLLFRGLARFGENYQNVFDSLPRSIKTLYTHALQSYIWNRIASRRLRQMGLELREGDMVGKKLQEKKEIKDQEMEEKEEEVLGGEDEAAEEEALQATPVTSENIANYSIYDLVLPLFGPQIKLQQGTWLQKCLLEELDHLYLSEEDLLFSAKAQNAGAAWRRMLVLPQIVQYELIAHGSPKDELQSPFYTLGEKVDTAKGDLKSLRIVLKLPKSAYATMAIREMLHVPSEFEIQRRLNSTYESHYGQ